MTDEISGTGIFETSDGEQTRLRTTYHGERVVGRGDTRAMAVHDLGERMQQLDERIQDGEGA